MLLLIGKQESRLRAVAIGLIALTAPALVLFLPVGVVRWVRKSSMTAGVFLICAAIQISVTLTNSTQVPHQLFPFWLPVAATLESWVYRVPLLIFFRQRLEYSAGGAMGVALGRTPANYSNLPSGVG